MSIFGPCQMVLDRTKYQGPYGVGQMSPWMSGQDQMVLQISRTFWCGQIVLWTKFLMVVLYRTKYQGPFGMDQMYANRLV